MSSAFTVLTAGEDALSLAMANEIVLAYSERRQVLGASAVSALSAGNSAQDKTLWLAMQTWCEANCTSFVDHVSGPLNPAGDDFLYFTLATWRAAAGLNVNGFQRSLDNGASFSYGTIQAGDHWGRWNFEDLQKGFGALKWRIITATVTPNSGMLKAVSTGVFEGDWPEAQDAADALWAAADYSPSDEGGRAYSKTQEVNAGVNYITSLERRYCSYRVTVSNNIPKITQLWIKGLISAEWPYVLYFNAQGDDRTENVYSLMETIPENINLIIDFGVYTGSGKPGWYASGGNKFGYEDSPQSLLKYNFTNA